jgi:hypothetical protein
MKNLSHFPKTDIRFWQRAVFRQSYTRNGKSFLTKAWAMKVAHEGRPLGTLNKAVAAATARDIYLFLAANGWEAAVARFKKTKRVAGERNTERAITLGEFLDAVFRVSTSRSTIEGYATAFRKIVADLFGLSGDPAKFDHRSGGREKWLARVPCTQAPFDNDNCSALQSVRRLSRGLGRDDNDSGMSEGEKEPDPVLGVCRSHQLPGHIVDGGDVISVNCIAKTESISQKSGLWTARRSSLPFTN